MSKAVKFLEFKNLLFKTSRLRTVTVTIFEIKSNGLVQVLLEAINFPIQLHDNTFNFQTLTFLTYFFPVHYFRVNKNRGECRVD